MMLALQIVLLLLALLGTGCVLILEWFRRTELRPLGQIDLLRWAAVFALWYAAIAGPRML
jgi:hypothetical protein